MTKKFQIVGWFVVLFASAALGAKALVSAQPLEGMLLILAAFTHLDRLTNLLKSRVEEYPGGLIVEQRRDHDGQ